MINKKRNQRRSITLSKEQWKYLDKISEKLGISTSKIICWLCMKNIRAIQQWRTPEEIMAIREILLTPWIKDPEDDEL